MSFLAMNIRTFVRRTLAAGCVCLALHPVRAAAEVTKVVITSQGVVAGGHSFGTVGTYEKLVGRIEFALDPADPHNRGITDLRSHRRALTDGMINGGNGTDSDRDQRRSVERCS